MKSNVGSLLTSKWRTAWITSRLSVSDATSSRLRGNNVLRTIWKAGCLETCTSGLGLGPGCNSTAYTTDRWQAYPVGKLSGTRRSDVVWASPVPLHTLIAMALSTYYCSTIWVGYELISAKSIHAWSCT